MKRKHNTLAYFAVKPRKSPLRNTNECVIYTRVSSKEQAENNGSLDTQRKYCVDFVNRNHLELIEQFGGTYESAKSDKDRKEFQRMLNFVSKNKSISTIVVLSLDRFSRTGGEASCLISQLREKGITVRAVQQDFSQEVYSGIMMTDMSLMLAKADNMMRRDKATTGTLEKLRQGFWTCALPKGYTNLNKHRTADKHKLIINEIGKLIRKAYQLRIQGYTYEAIHNKLAPLGLNVPPKHIGRLLANPFYAGKISHSLLQGELVDGKHPPLVGITDFLKANGVSQHPTGDALHSHKKHESLPLKTFMREEETQMPFTGYIAKKGSIPYYKNRNRGKAVNVRADKVNALFEAFLGRLQIQEDLSDEIKKRTLIQLKEKLGDQIRAQKNAKSQIRKLEKNQDKLLEMYVEGKVNSDAYERMNLIYSSQKLELQRVLNSSPLKSSNLEKAVENGIQIAMDPASLWTSANFDQKRNLQKMIFPEGILFNKEKCRVRTEKINEVIFEIAQLISDSNENKNGGSEFTFTFPHQVPQAGLEPARTLLFTGF